MNISLNSSISRDRSLDNPNTSENDYFAWSEEYYQCHCPSESEDIDDETILHETDYYKTLNKYIGLLYCTMERPCIIKHEGKNWTGSLLPDFALKEISLKVDYRNVSNEQTLAFICSFDAKDTLLYNITW